MFLAVTQLGIDAAERGNVIPEYLLQRPQRPGDQRLRAGMMAQRRERQRRQRLPGPVAGIAGGQRVSGDLLQRFGGLRPQQQGPDPGQRGQRPGANRVLLVAQPPQIADDLCADAGISGAVSARDQQLVSGRPLLGLGTQGGGGERRLRLLPRQEGGVVQREGHVSPYRAELKDPPGLGPAHRAGQHVQHQVRRPGLAALDIGVGRLVQRRAAGRRDRGKQPHEGFFPAPQPPRDRFQL